VQIIWDIEVKLQAFLTLALDKGQWAVAYTPLLQTTAEEQPNTLVCGFYMVTLVAQVFWTYERIGLPSWESKFWPPAIVTLPNEAWQSEDPNALLLSSGPSAAGSGSPASIRALLFEKHSCLLPHSGWFWRLKRPRSCENVREWLRQNKNVWKLWVQSVCASKRRAALMCGKQCDEEQEMPTEPAGTRRVREDSAVVFTEVIVN
jgi:hypothetical protein